MNPTVHTIRVPGPGEGQTHLLTVREWGDPENPRILTCVHGLTRNATDFDYLARAMYDDYRILCPDVAGRGASGWLEDKMAYGYPLYVSDMLYVLKHFGIARTDWLGTSMGGLIGIFIAALADSPIQRLVLNDVGPFVAKEGLERIIAYVGKMRSFTTRQEAETYLRTAYAPFGISTEGQWRHLFDGSIVEDATGVRLAYDPGIAVPLQAAAREGVKDVDLWDVWENLTQPVMVLRGELSDVLGLEVARRMARKPAVTLKEYAGIGHAPSLYEPQQIEDVRQWFASMS